jgi:ribosome-binding factor A
MAQELTFDTKKPENAFREQRIDPLRRGERGNRELTVSIASKGIPYDLTGCTVRFVGTTGTGQLVGPTEIEVANEPAGMVRHVLPAEMSTDAGLAHWYYEIYKGEDYLDTTESCSVKVLQNADIGGQQATVYISILEQAKIDEQARTVAETKRAEAEKQRDANETEREISFMEMSTKLSAAAAAAKAARDDATASATAAKESKDAAAASALSAGKSADSAAAAIKETADAAADARLAADEARGSISADKSMYFKRITDENGDTWPVIVDTTVKGY